jgi:transcriptional regulator with XRE-family HTH domain
MLSTPRLYRSSGSFQKVVELSKFHIKHNLAENPFAVKLKDMARPTTSSRLSHALTAALLVSGISQAELSRRIGVSTSIVSQWMSGESDPQVGTLEYILDAMGITFEVFARIAMEDENGGYGTGKTRGKKVPASENKMAYPFKKLAMVLLFVSLLWHHASFVIPRIISISLGF